MSSNHETSYGPYNVIDVKEIVEVQELENGKMVVNSSNEIISGDNVYSISIILPKWHPDIEYDKEILADIYSMIKSIEWQ